MLAKDYTTDHVKDVGGLYTGCRCLEGMESELFEALHREEQGGVRIESMQLHQEPMANEYLIVRNGSKSALATYRAADKSFVIIQRKTIYGIVPRNAEQSFAVHALCNPQVPLVTVSGKAGTGKTLLTLAAALEQGSAYRQIMLARPIVPLSNKDIGYLPGDIQSKISPYMQPLAYIRGRSLIRMYMIVDEAQNLIPHEVKTIITRAGEGTKVVFTGDIHQINHPYLDSQSNGLSHLIEKMQGQPLYAHVNLEKGKRSELVMLASDLL